ncbi:MAG: SDR family NAD(P)-dependent oxidoreductase [Microthrixaceae bacterium]
MRPHVRSALDPHPGSATSLDGRRVVITGAARGIGEALARRLTSRGARVALVGLEPERLAEVASELDAPWWECDVGDMAQVDRAVDSAADAFGGLDVVVANAGVAAQLPLVGGDPRIMEQTLRVNVLGAYYTARAGGRHVGHPGGYAVLVSSLAAAVHVPLLGAYSASKAAVEALGNTLRQEVRGTGARVGVAYFAELDTEMTSRGFGTEAARSFLRGRALTRVTPLSVGVDALERGICRRSRVIAAPWYVRPLLPTRRAAQTVVEVVSRKGVAMAVEIARDETVDLTTPQPSTTRVEADRSLPEC